MFDTVRRPLLQAGDFEGALQDCEGVLGGRMVCILDSPPSPGQTLWSVLGRRIPPDDAIVLARGARTASRARRVVRPVLPTHTMSR